MSVSDNISKRLFQCYLQHNGSNHDDSYNQLLYDEFAVDKSHHDPALTFKKVVLIDNLYSANLGFRMSQVRKSPVNCPNWLANKTNPYQALVDHLYSKLYRDHFLTIIQVDGLVGETLTRNRLRRVIKSVELFAELLREMGIYKNDSAVSFASKYLHFHSGIVPVYDSRASTSLHNLHQGSIATRSRGKKTGDPKNVGIPYAEFGGHFMLALETVYQEEAFTRKMIKDLDGYLYLANRGECELFES